MKNKPAVRNLNIYFEVSNLDAVKNKSSLARCLKKNSAGPPEQKNKQKN